MKKKILIISGGISKERLISLDTGLQVANELKKNGYNKNKLTFSWPQSGNQPAFRRAGRLDESSQHSRPHPNRRRRQPLQN